MKAYTPADMRAADKYTTQNLGVPGITLMQRAAETLFEALGKHIGKGKFFVILCGKGNNGGDGYALAHMLSESFENTVCISVLGEPAAPDARYFYGLCKRTEAGACPVKIIDSAENYMSCIEAVKKADVIIDAVFGTGFSGEIESGSTCAEIIELSNASKCTRISADIPSGACAESGRASKITFRADITVTFAKAKPGLFSYPAREYCGEIKVADIGIPESVFDMFDKSFEIADTALVREYMPKRQINSNKGTYGKALIVAGSENMTGAAHLACMGALRLGAGLVCMASEPCVLDVLKCRLSEPIFLPVGDTDEDTDRLIEYAKGCSAVLIGCGLGKGEKVTKRVCRMIKECDAPIILDADGINAVSGNINILSEAKNGIILTPHPLEFSRISGLSVSEISENRISCALDFSKRYGCNLLLKGAGTVICEKGRRLCITTSGSSALSKGGSGDILAGMIASIAAQGASLYESAVCAAQIHGAAGDRLSGELSEYGVLPSEIPGCAARVLADILR